MFDEQAGWAVAVGVDFMIAETFEHHGEARLALEAVRESGLPVVVTLSLQRGEAFRDGVSVVAYRLRGNDQIG